MAVESVRYLTDQESLQALVDQMQDTDRREYMTYRSRTMEPAFTGRTMVVYTLRGREPDRVEVVKFLDFWSPFQEGPRCRLVYRGREQVITTVPSRLGDRDIFVSVPQNFVLRWAGQEVQSGLQFRAQYAVLIQARSREDLKVDGDTQCCTMKRFIERYPHKRDEVRF